MSFGPSIFRGDSLSRSGPVSLSVCRSGHFRHSFSITSLSCFPILSYSLSFSFFLILSHFHSLSFSSILILSHSHSLSFPFSLNLNISHSLHSHSLSFSLFLSLPLSLSFCLILIFAHFHPLLFLLYLILFQNFSQIFRSSTRFSKF